MEVIVTVNISIDDIHSERVGFVGMEVFLVEYNVGIMFIFGDGDKVRENVMLLRLEWTHFDSHVFIVSRFR